jgi:hypothetical protein
VERPDALAAGSTLVMTARNFPAGSGVRAARPNYNQGAGEMRSMKVEVGGLFGLLILIADVWRS